MKIALIIAVGTVVIPLLVLAGIKLCDAIEKDYKKDTKVKCFFRYFRKTDYYKDDEPCLTFNQFLSFFNVAPERWTIGRRYEEGRCVMIYDADDGNEYTFYFTTYGEQLKFIHWSENRQKHKKVISTAKMMNGFIESVRRDSRRAEQKAIDEAQKLHTEIEKRLEVQKGEEK